jgi:hypothetical protein
MIAVTGLRFVNISRDIDSMEVHPGSGSRIDLTLASLLILLGCAVFFYLATSVSAEDSTPWCSSIARRDFDNGNVGSGVTFRRVRGRP